MEAAAEMFVQLTRESHETANFYLESVGGDLDKAIQMYYDNAGVPHEPQHHPVPAPVPQPAAAPPPAQPRAVADPSARRPQPAAAAAGPKPAGGAAPSRPAAGPRIASLNDYRGGGGGGGPFGGDDDEDMDDDDEGNEYYAGGQNSGVAVKGNPGKGRADADQVFDRARQLGGREATEEEARRARGDAPRRPAGTGAFSGAARTLAGASVPGAAAAGPGAAGAAGAAEADEEGHGHAEGTLCHTVAFYADGVFTVDDGEPRRMDDRANQRFLAALMKGEVPEELRPADPEQHVDIHLVRKTEEWKDAPKPKYKAFSGAARKLTDAAEEAAGPSGTAPPPAAAAPGPSSSTAAAGAGTGYTYEVDEQQPAASIQFRFWDGKKIVAKFNLTNTIGDVRHFLLTARPDLPASFKMKTMGFPPTPLSDEAATIKDAGMDNAVVMVSQ